GSLAGTAHTADEGGLGTMDALINNLQTIQNVANLSADITPETIIAFQTSITDYVTGTAKEGTKEGTGDSQAVFAELKSAIGESIESVAKGEDTAVDQQHNIEILLQAFGGKLIGETIGGDTITADNITVQQLTDLLAKAFTAISKM
ncbi:MAG: hypothetical protein V1719_00975, partial [Patescibacteria group bacterium]